jgi:hypothetical protein
MPLAKNIKLSLAGKLPADVSTLKNQFCTETGRWQEKRKSCLPSTLGFIILVPDTASYIRG